MRERMIGVRVSITAYVDDDYPGFVECNFTDAHQQRHCFLEKTVYVSADLIDSTTSYPYPGVIACEIVGRRFGDSDTEIISIDSELPWGIESIDGLTQFEVFRDAMVEWELGTSDLLPWNGNA
jgi:hypothetical protein